MGERRGCRGRSPLGKNGQLRKDLVTMSWLIICLVISEYGARIYCKKNMEKGGLSGRERTERKALQGEGFNY